MFIRSTLLLGVSLFSISLLNAGSKKIAPPANIPLRAAEFNFYASAQTVSRADCELQEEEGGFGLFTNKLVAEDRYGSEVIGSTYGQPTRRQANYFGAIMLSQAKAAGYCR